MKMTTTISVARALSNRYGIEVRMQGDKAWTDGKVINIPDLGSDIDEGKLAVLRGYIDHEAGGHGRHTDFEVLRGKDLTPEIMNLCNAIEDIRVEALLSAEFEGCRNNLAAMNQRLIERIWASGKKASPEVSMMANGFKLIAGQELNDVPDVGIAQRWFGEDIMERIAACKSTADSFELARELVGRLEGEAEEQSQESEGKGKAGDKAEERKGGETAGQGEQGQGEGKPEAGEGGEGDDAAPGESGGEPEGSSGEQGKEGKKAEGESGDTGNHGEKGKAGDKVGADAGGEDVAEAKTASDAAGTGMESGAEKTAREVLDSLRDMKDKGKELGEMLTEAARENITSGGYSIFSKEDDEVVVAHEATSDIKYRNLREILGNLNTVRGKIARAFLSEKAVRWVGDRDQGKINNRALCRVATGCNRVFKQRVESRHVDTASTFLVDFSGSMQNKSGGITLIRHAMQAVVLFLESLEQAGVASEVLGYTTGRVHPDFWSYMEEQGREGKYGEMRHAFGRIDTLLTIIFKEFSERMSAKVRRRVSAYEDYYMSQNCDADSLRVAYERIVQRKEKRKIIFVLTDGAVCSNGNDELGRRELRRLVEGIERQGQVELVAVDFMSGEAKRYYGNVIEVMYGDNLAAKLLEGLKRFLF